VGAAFRGGGGGLTGEVVQVSRLGLIELKHLGERVEDLLGGRTGLALFQPRVVTGAHARELGELLTTQTRHSTCGSVGAQSDVGRRDPVAAALEIGPEAFQFHDFERRRNGGIPGVPARCTHDAGMVAERTTPHDPMHE
jgi:hypothetical protein